MGAAPVGERTVRIAPVSLEVASVVGQPRVVWGELEASGDDVGRLVVVMRPEVGS